MFAFFIGAVALVGWGFDVNVLKRVHPDFVTMKANTAICLMFLSLALRLLVYEPVPALRRGLARVLAAIVVIIAALTLCEHVLMWNLGIDELLFHETSASAGQSFPGRMGIASCISFVLLGVALICLDTRSRGHHCANGLTFGAALAVLLAFLYYFYGVDEFEAISMYATIALHSVAAFFCIGAGILLARPQRGLAAALLAAGVGSVMARRMLPALGVIVLLGWLREAGASHGLYGSGFGTAALVLLSLMLITALIWMTASAVNRSEEALRQSREEARRQLQELEAIYDSAPLGLCVLDLELRYRRINRFLANLNGYAVPAHIGRTVRDIVPSVADQAAEGLRRVLAAGAPVHVELRGKVASKPDVEGVWEESWYPIRDASGQIVAVGVVAEDVTERRNMEQVLRRSEARLSTTLNHLRSGVIVAHEQGQVMYWNPAALAMHGYATMDEANAPLGDYQQIFELRRGGRLLPLSEWPITRIVRGETVRDEEVAVRRLDQGWERVVVYSGSMVETSFGERLAFLSVYDLTEQRKAEAALRESEARLSLFIRYAPAGLAMFDRQMRYLAASRRWIDDYHIGENPVGRSHYDVFPNIPERWREVHQRALAGEVLTADEDPFPQPDGSIQWLKWEVRPWYSADGAIGGILISAEDVTARVHAKNVLQQREALLRTVAGEAKVGLIMVDKDHRYLFANQTYAEIAGVPEGEIIGRRVSEVLPHSYDALRPRLEAALRGEQVRFELHMPARPPEQPKDRFYEVVYEPRVNESGEPYVVVVLADVTERRRAQEVLEETVAERTAALRETIGQLEAFSYSITHDMRGPLRAMNSFAQILRDEYSAGLDDAGRDYLRRIIDGARRLDQLIQDVLQYSRLTKLDLPLEPTDLATMIEDVIQQYPDIAEQRSAIELRLDPRPPLVRANSGALTQVISNLITNALKFTAPGRAARVVVACETRGDYVRFSVRDNGIGIAPEYQRHIFGMFQRLHGKEYAGTGIGLAIVKKAVERMGGNLGLESEPGKGSTFWVDLKKAVV